MLQKSGKVLDNGINKGSVLIFTSYKKSRINRLTDNDHNHVLTITIL